MHVTKEQTSPVEILLTIEVDADTVDKAIQNAYKKLGKGITIPGFRKGKAPMAILETYLNEERVKEEAADEILEPAYTQALEETDVKPYDIADVEVVSFEKGQPLIFKAKVPQEPVVELGPYTGLKVKKTVKKVTNKDVDAEVNSFLARNARYPEVEGRAVEAGDLVLYEASNNDNPEEEPKRNVAKVGETTIPAFDEGIVGMNIDDEKVIDVAYPEDYSEPALAGKTLPLKIKIIEIRHEELPKLTDDWVKENFAPKEGVEVPEADIIDTVEKLRSTIKKSMEDYAETNATIELENSIVEQIVEGSKIEFNDVMIKDQVKANFEALANQLTQRKVTIEDYLKHIGKTFEELNTEYEEEARKLLRISLVLREIAHKEGIKVEDEDIKQEAEVIAAERGVPVETAVAYVEKTGMLDRMRNQILHKKIMKFLIDSSKSTKK